jgi:hypothetical protein
MRAIDHETIEGGCDVDEPHAACDRPIKLVGGVTGEIRCVLHVGHTSPHYARLHWRGTYVSFAEGETVFDVPTFGASTAFVDAIHEAIPNAFSDLDGPLHGDTVKD